MQLARESQSVIDPAIWQGPVKRQGRSMQRWRGEGEEGGTTVSELPRRETLSLACLLFLLVMSMYESSAW
jgi:hypothetical protein